MTTIIWAIRLIVILLVAGIIYEGALFIQAMRAGEVRKVFREVEK